MLKLLQVSAVFLSIYGNLNAQNINFTDTNLLKKIIANKVDTNGDNKISLNEASAVTVLDISDRQDNVSNVSKITYLNGIEAFTNLQSLNIRYNNIRSIDLSKNINLQALYCEGNSIKNLDLSNNNKLVTLMFGRNPVSTLDVSHLPLLRTLNCIYTGLEILDVSKNENLVTLNCLYNPYIKTICVKSISYAENNPEYRKDTTAKWSETCINGLLDMVHLSKIAIYPNPVKDMLTIIGDFEKISIYDNLGSKVLETAEQKFSINSLPMGIYQGVITNKNKQIQSFRLVKE